MVAESGAAVPFCVRGEAMISRREVAEQVGTSEARLRQWEARGVLPPLTAKNLNKYWAIAATATAARENGLPPRVVWSAFQEELPV